MVLLKTKFYIILYSEIKLFFLKIFVLQYIINQYQILDQ